MPLLHTNVIHKLIVSSFRILIVFSLLSTCLFNFLFFIIYYFSFSYLVSFEYRMESLFSQLKELLLSLENIENLKESMVDCMLMTKRIQWI